MSRSELDNFINKFHQLRQAGFTAHLDVDTHAGQSWLGLRVMLGTGPFDSPKQRHRGPSYTRRQERRKAARLAAESSHENQGTEKVLETQKADKVVEIPVVSQKTDQVVEMTEYSRSFEE